MKISTSQLKRLYCICRQGERSIDFALRSDKGLSQLRSYYRGERLQLLNQVLYDIGVSHNAGPIHRAVSMTILEKTTRVLLLPIGLFAGWRWFSKYDLICACSDLTLFRDILQTDCSVTNDELVRLRMCLYSCQLNLKSMTLMGRQLETLGLLTEHFGQSDWSVFKRIDELLT